MRNDREDIDLMERLHDLSGSTWVYTFEDRRWVVALLAGGPPEILAEIGAPDGGRLAAVIEPDDVRVLARHRDLLRALRRAVAVLEGER